MYYRRKILFSILEVFENKLTRTQMQKLAFIYSQRQKKKAYEFIPYYFGCYSFQVNQDLHALTKRGFINEVKENGFSYWVKADDTNYSIQLKKDDKEILSKLQIQFKGYSQDDLIQYTYTRYPYYVINSTIANKYLNEEELAIVAQQKPDYKEKKLFTIGYEGISLENYINKLLLQNVTLLCDVRKNSFSMKYGFSKKQLKYACEAVGISFLHIPELGINGGKRKDLKTMADYNQLFSEYEATTLVDNKEHLLRLANLFTQYNRIALTCFEASHCMCHRGRVANALEAIPGWNIKTSHL